MVALEAMACGVPVVASAVGGLRDLVVDGETGLHAPARDPMRIAQAIRTLTHDSALRFRCATQGRQRALEYAWSSVVDSLLQLYERVIAEGA
jgi:glycosyltransferase involved in cell wall biosynthesis